MLLVDGGWGFVVVIVILYVFIVDGEKQCIEFGIGKDGCFVVFLIIDVQGIIGGGVGEIEILFDEQLFLIVMELENFGFGEMVDMVEIVNGGMIVVVVIGFLQIIGYWIGMESFDGQCVFVKMWVVNGKVYVIMIMLMLIVMGIDYVFQLIGIDVMVCSSICVVEDGMVVFEVIVIEGMVVVNMFGFLDNVFFFGLVGVGVVFDCMVISFDSIKNVDEYIVVNVVMLMGQKGVVFVFFGIGVFVGSVIINVMMQVFGGIVFWNICLMMWVMEVVGWMVEIGFSVWFIYFMVVVDSWVMIYVFLWVIVLFVVDCNGDVMVDWQDVVIWYCEVDILWFGVDWVVECVVSRILFNFVFSVMNYFDFMLDNIKCIVNQIDGFGQWVFNKGFGSEGYDLVNIDYGGNYNECVGGFVDFNIFVDEGVNFNVDMSVYVNVMEIYFQVNVFDFVIFDGMVFYKLGWNWFDQLYYINQQMDFGMGWVLDCFQQLCDEVFGFSGVYIDVYYFNGWVVEEFVDEFNVMDFEVVIEWGDKFVDSMVWFYWLNDLGYGGVINKGINFIMVCFIQNGQVDVWNDDVLFGQQCLVDVEGWVGN